MENQSTAETAKKKYQAPVLKTFGKIGDITNFNNFGGGAVDDGGGSPVYTS